MWTAWQWNLGKNTIIVAQLEILKIMLKFNCFWILISSVKVLSTTFLTWQNISTQFGLDISHHWKILFIIVELDKGEWTKKHNLTKSGDMKEKEICWDSEHLEMFQIDCWNMVTYQRALVRKLFYSFLLFDSPKTFVSCAMFIQRESFK